MNILVIDDLATPGYAVASYVADALNAEGSHVASLNDALASAKKPNLIVLKTPMPGLDGETSVSRLRSAFPYSKIIALVLNPSVDAYRRLRKAGIHGYISIQDHADELVRAARAVLAGQQHITPRLAMESWEPVTDQLSSLTDRERSVLILFAQGMSMKEIASELYISLKTAETHRNNIGRKLGNPNRSQLTFLALNNGLVTPDLLAI